jgi:hypothetical protein
MVRKKAIALLASGSLFGAVAWVTSGSGAATGPGVIRITGTQVRYARVDVGRAGRSPGDTEIATELLYNRNITPKSLGHSELVCTFTIGPSRNCRATVFLPKGKLVVGGSIFARQFYQLAILGGTGLYDDARGTLTVTKTGQAPRRELLLFRLVG